MSSINNKKSEDYISTSRSGSSTHGNGPFLAKVISHLDPTYMGTLEVELYREVGNSGTGKEGQLHKVRMMTPFYGVTSSDFLSKDADTHNNTQKSYGMWFIPPDIGTTVMVFFVDGDAKRGFWLGCIPDEGLNFMMPGLAATERVVEGKNKERLPVSEYNKLIHEEVKDPTLIVKPKNPVTAPLITQGLIRDDMRGITTSSSRREVPSAVFGISTPGPVDKRPGAKKGKVGKAEHRIDNIFVSRLGGTTFVLDDGDDKYLRIKPPGGEKGGPPDYAATVEGEKGGDPTIPHNELVRIRTRTGHQILLHNSEDLIYIGNARGTAWLEFTSDGKIEIYSSDSINLHTAADINFRVERDLNIEVLRNMNVRVEKEIHIETSDSFNVLANKSVKIKTTSNNIMLESGKDTSLLSAKNHIETAQQIHMNGPAAPKVTLETLKKHILPTEKKDKDGKVITIESILRRVPMHEPYPQHENLDPLMYNTANTDRDIEGRYGEPPTETLKEPADWWKKMQNKQPQYTRKKDPFLKVKGVDKK